MTKRMMALLCAAVLLLGVLTACSFGADSSEEDATTTTTAEETTTTTTTVVYPLFYVTATKLNVRSEPSTDGEPLGQLTYGAQVEVLETVDGWCRISYNGKVAYVSAAYLSLQQPPSTTATTTTTAAPTAPPTFPANSTGYVTATKLNVRRDPAINGEILGQILYGAEILVLETVDGWCRIEFEGKTAYISAEYVSLTPPPTTTAASTTTTAP